VRLSDWERKGEPLLYEKTGAREIHGILGKGRDQKEQGDFSNPQERRGRPGKREIGGAKNLCEEK